MRLFQPKSPEAYDVTIPPLFHGRKLQGKVKSGGDIGAVRKLGGAIIGSSGTMKLRQ
jgi:hypothetical protein